MEKYIVYFGSESPFNEALSNVVGHKISRLAERCSQSEHELIPVPTFVRNWCRDKDAIKVFVTEMRSVFGGDNTAFVHVYDMEEKSEHERYLREIISEDATLDWFLFSYADFLSKVPDSIGSGYFDGFPWLADSNSDAIKASNSE